MKVIIKQEHWKEIEVISTTSLLFIEQKGADNNDMIVIEREKLQELISYLKKELEKNK